MIEKIIVGAQAWLGVCASSQNLVDKLGKTQQICNQFAKAVAEEVLLSVNWGCCLNRVEKDRCSFVVEQLTEERKQQEDKIKKLEESTDKRLPVLKDCVVAEYEAKINEDSDDWNNKKKEVVAKLLEDLKACTEFLTIRNKDIELGNAIEKEIQDMSDVE